MDSRGIYIKGIFTYWAMIFAEVVFPVPGGPSKSTALGLLGSYLALVTAVILS